MHGIAVMSASGNMHADYFWSIKVSFGPRTPTLLSIELILTNFSFEPKLQNAAVCANDGFCDRLIVATKGSYRKRGSTWFLLQHTSNYFQAALQAVFVWLVTDANSDSFWRITRIYCKDAAFTDPNT